MSTPRMLPLIKSCRMCPNSRSGECSLVDQRIPNADVVADFCPLPQYPSAIIAGLGLTVEGLREPHKYGFEYALINHLAAKLKLNLNAGPTNFTIPYKRGGKEYEVCLAFQYITGIDMPGYVINFLDRDDTFKLRVEGSEPELRVQSKDHPGLWESLTLAI